MGNKMEKEKKGNKTIKEKKGNKTMKGEKMTIENANREDASLIADAIIEAIGQELTLHLAGENHTPEDVHDLFARLAARDDSQYSYLNSRVARNADGSPMGVCVSYDGAELKRLRRAFFEEANATFGWGLTAEEIEEIPGETEPDEFYLDTLMTLPAFRGRGVGEALIRDASEKAVATGKPLGLLCDTDNLRARRLYDRIGFTDHGLRPFAGHMMNHLQLIREDVRK